MVCRFALELDPSIRQGGPRHIRWQNRLGPTSAWPGLVPTRLSMCRICSRSLHFGGVPIPLPAPQSRRWPIMVNDDRLTYFLITHGWVHSESLSQLRPGDVILIRYPLTGQSASPTVWSHMALVVHVRPVLVDAHNAAFRHIRLVRLSRGAIMLCAFRVNQQPHTAPLTVPARHSQIEIAWRDLWTSRGVHLYWGQCFRVTRTHHQHVWLSGVNGFVPVQAVAPMSLTPTVMWHGHPRVILGIAPDRRTLISTAHAPTPAWTGHPTNVMTSRSTFYFHSVVPQPVQVIRTTPVQPTLGLTSIPKSFSLLREAPPS